MVNKLEEIKSYNGNPLLKKTNQSIEWSQEQVSEYVKCSENPIYFTENYMKIININDGLVNFKLYDYQREMIMSMYQQRYSVINSSRQIGKSITTCAYILWYIIFNSEKTVALLANKGDTAREILSRVQLAYQHLPSWLQQGIKEWNKGSLWLENDSRVIAAATSTSSIRGFSINCVTGDTKITVRDKITETIHHLTIDKLIENIEGTNITQLHKKRTISNYYYDVLTEEGFKDFDGILVTKNKSTIHVQLGENTLKCTSDHKIKINNEFIEARKLKYTQGNTQTVYDLINVKDTHHYITNGITSHNCLFIDECAFIENWDQFFTSVFPTISSGTDTKIILTSTPNGLNHFYSIWNNAINKRNQYNPILVKWDQIPGRNEKWKQDTLASMNFDIEKFNQEYEAEFLGSSGTLISGWKLKELLHLNPISEKDGLIQYFKPEPKHAYLMVCDVSRGKGLDFSAFQLIDVSAMPYQQVAVFRNNAITPIDYAEVIHRVALNYNNASVLIEVNDIGEQVSHALHYDMAYDNVLFTENKGRSGKQITNGFGSKGQDKGIKTSRTVKSTGCSMMKMLIEQNQLIINDFNTINELSTFSKKGVTYQAEPNKHDDLIICLVLFSWLTTQDYFKEYTDINTLQSLREKTEEELDQDMIPFGFVLNGREQFVDETYDEIMPDAWMWDIKENF